MIQMQPMVEMKEMLERVEMAGPVEVQSKLVRLALWRLLAELLEGQPGVFWMAL